MTSVCVKSQPKAGCSTGKTSDGLTLSTCNSPGGFAPYTLFTLPDNIPYDVEVDYIRLRSTKFINSSGVKFPYFFARLYQ